MPDRRITERVHEWLAEHLPELPPLEPFQLELLDRIFGLAHRRNTACRRAHRAGYTPPRDNGRMRALNLDCHRRQLARRRRNR